MLAYRFGKFSHAQLLAIKPCCREQQIRGVTDTHTLAKSKSRLKMSIQLSSYAHTCILLGVLIMYREKGDQRKSACVFVGVCTKVVVLSSRKYRVISDNLTLLQQQQQHQEAETGIKLFSGELNDVRF